MILADSFSPERSVYYLALEAAKINAERRAVECSRFGSAPSSTKCQLLVYGISIGTR